jgi:hypothetical protein
MTHHARAIRVHNAENFLGFLFRFHAFEARKAVVRAALVAGQPLGELDAPVVVLVPAFAAAVDLREGVKLRGIGRDTPQR